MAIDSFRQDHPGDLLPKRHLRPLVRATKQADAVNIKRVQPPTLANNATALAATPPPDGLTLPDPGPAPTPTPSLPSLSCNVCP